ncbi:MAG: tyrosine-protein phosphatase [Pseudomonadota bacterium]
MAKIGKTARTVLKHAGLRTRLAMMTYSPDWLKSSLGPVLSFGDMLFIDHGVFRMFYLNLHRIADSDVWRSAQPAPHHIARMARKEGIRTIVNLRGERMCGSYWLEEAACRKHGIAFENYQVRSRAAPSVAELRGARDLFQRVEYPMWMHCKSGADRAGLMSVLYLHVHKGVPIEEAVQQLSLKYGHIRQADTGVLDYFFERYMAYNKETPIEFFDWVETVYDDTEVRDTFRAQGWANRIVNTILRRE